VLEARGRGEPLKQISADLGISISSADSYRRRAVDKLNASSTFDAVRKWDRQQARQKSAGKIRR
jgi:DNA-binding CsgD family transcriptional regulator